MAANAEKQRSEKRSRPLSAASTVEQPGNGTVPGHGQPMMDLAFLRGLIDAVDQSGIDSLEIHRAGTRIRIAKTPASAPVGALSSSPALLPAPSPALVPAAAAPSTAVPPAAEPASPAASHLVDIKSPMVGTFYRSPAPEAPSYVEIGSHVSKGQTLCILEAMKLMNELESEVDGIVRQVLVDNADPVEYGQVLFRIEPAGR
ncbi:MAG TPA: acetyl-CoA carboxylase biotin carboxyl carrier protein [Longimicrobiales bacterium]|nr:acetyl-CoA carboxylase biotin carboxyl carrier protein [Longimicrobiales bacterium]